MCLKEVKVTPENPTQVEIEQIRIVMFVPLYLGSRVVKYCTDIAQA